jgi:hypothetical protein
MKPRLQALYDEAERLHRMGLEPWETAARLVEFRRDEVTQDPTDPSLPEHFLELACVLRFCGRPHLRRRKLA